jgi:Ca-activated chloride channel family protein
VAAFLAVSATAVKTPARSPSADSAFHAESSLVLVPVTVLDRRGATVTDLTRNDFTVSENGIRRDISSFSEDEAPVSIGVVFDMSGSMTGVLGEARDALRAVLADANSDDEAFVDTVSTRPGTYAPFTRDVESILRPFTLTKAGGSTALIDTIYTSLERLRSGNHSIKALIVVSDGMDNHSRHTKAELMGRLMESDAQIYSISLIDSSPAHGAAEMLEAARGLTLLDDLCSATGGIGFRVSTQREVARASVTIGQVLRTRYNIGYVPAPSHDGLWRRIEVRVARPGMRVYARRGYHPA